MEGLNVALITSWILISMPYNIFPDDAEVIEVAKGRAFLIKKDIFRNLMWYSMPDSTRHYPLSIESVKKIKEQNRQGIKPEALETVEIMSGKFKEAEPAFVDVVGHISLKSLEKNSRKRRDNNRNNNNRSKTRPISSNKKIQ